MRQFVILIFQFLAVFGFSQTKLIAHKSHSGSDQTFALAAENNLFENDNLGLGRMEIETIANLDSVVYVSKDKVIVFSSEYTQRYYQAFKQKCTRDELTKLRKDTVTIRPKSLKKGLTILEVQAKLDSSKIYKNDLTKTKFIDFDENIKKQKNRKNKKSVFPIISNFPNFLNQFFLIVILGFLSVLVYLSVSSLNPNLRHRKLTLFN